MISSRPRVALLVLEAEAVVVASVAQVDPLLPLLPSEASRRTQSKPRVRSSPSLLGLQEVVIARFKSATW
jgi:hypothetical protein